MLNFHIFFREEESELVEALDMEEGGGDDDYWENTVILQQTMFFIFSPD